MPSTTETKKVLWVHRFSTDDNPDNSEIISAETEDAAYKYLESFPASSLPKGYIFLSLEKKRGRGGARPGAGAKKGNIPHNKRFSEPTKFARIPESMDVTAVYLKFQELQMLLSLWEEKIGDADNDKRVRYSKAKELLKDVAFLLED